LKTHKERTHAKNNRQRMGVYEVGNEEDQRKVHEELAEKGLEIRTVDGEINGN